MNGIYDCHVHTHRSNDAAHTATEMARAARTKGMAGFCVTDHFDMEDCPPEGLTKLLESVRRDVEDARQECTELEILLGMELGQYYIDNAVADVLAGIPCDFILASMHRTPHSEDFWKIDFTNWKDEELDRLMLDYLEVLLCMVEEWGRFDSLTHMNIPMRYMKLYGDIDWDLHRYDDEVDRVLKALVRAGKALELNTSGLRNATAATMPPPWVLTRFRELGGKYVTLGSDAHIAGDIGAGVPAGLAMLKEAGFTHYTVYRAHTPHLVKIL